MDFLMEDTIAAISTPPGEGGIGIIRISGSDAVEITGRIFCGPGDKPVKLKPRQVHYGHIVDVKSGEKIDEVIVSFMKAPRSYTTQDVVEINCHGGPIILKKVLDLVLNKGARIAEPGEFTKRAFMGGRIDLAQAEAVMDMIKARTDESRRVAFSQLKGELSRLINKLREDLVNFLIQLEARIDFCEDDIPPLDSQFKLKQVDVVLGEVNEILNNFEKGRIYREGIRTCIAGPPNVGKSTLMNTLLGEDRAIVTHIPGTTRDRIEETLNLKGIPLVLTDTAGLRKSDDIVESIGMKKTYESVREADLILFMMDASVDDAEIFSGILDYLNPDRTLVVVNKIDLGNNYPRKFIEGYFPGSRIVEVSLLERNNIQTLEDKIIGMVFDGKTGSASDVILSNARHRDALRRTAEHLEEVRNSISMDMPDDFITIDLKAALDSLGEIVGKVTAEDLLDRIFSSFCIGK